VFWIHILINLLKLLLDCFGLLDPLPSTIKTIYFILGLVWECKNIEISELWCGHLFHKSCISKWHHLYCNIDYFNSAIAKLVQLQSLDSLWIIIPPRLKKVHTKYNTIPNTYMSKSSSYDEHEKRVICKACLVTNSMWYFDNIVPHINGSIMDFVISIACAFFFFFQKIS